MFRSSIETWAIESGRIGSPGFRPETLDCLGSKVDNFGIPHLDCIRSKNFN